MEKKIYANKKEKVQDLLIGLFFVPIASGIIFYLLVGIINREIASVIMVILLAVFTFYMLLKRKFICLGIIAAFVIIPVVIFLILLGTCFLVMPRYGR